MVLEWRVREHEDMDREAIRDATTLNALRQCGLLKFYYTSNMRGNVHLLETLIGYWDQYLDFSHLQGETFEITVEDMYFITGIFHRGMSVNLEGTGRGGVPMSL